METTISLWKTSGKGRETTRTFRSQFFKVGHFYFGKRRTFLFWFDTANITVYIEDTIHNVIFYKKKVQEFVRFYRKKYGRLKAFKEHIAVDKDFHIQVTEKDMG